MRYLKTLLLGVTMAACWTGLACAADRNVSVYYYPWYDLPTNGHWQEGALRTRLVPPSPPALGLYSSQDEQVIRQHLDWSEQYGIDNWICSWWGRNSFEDRTLREHILPTLADRETKFCIYYESQGLLNFNEREEIVFDDKAIVNFKSDVEYLAEHLFRHPNYQRIDGRPVLHLYLSRCFAGRYAEGLTAARNAAREFGLKLYLVGDEIYWGKPNPQRVGLMDAITTYSMHGPKDFAGYPHQSELLKHMSLKFDEYSRIAGEQGVRVIPNVMPGYNNRGSGGKVYATPRRYAEDKDSTSTLREMIRWSEKYIDPQLNAVCITSFNEWHEDTQIEPTVLAPVTNQDESGKRQMTTGYHYRGYGTKHLELVQELLGSTDASPR